MFRAFWGDSLIPQLPLIPDPMAARNFASALVAPFTQGFDSRATPSLHVVFSEWMGESRKRRIRIEEAKKGVRWWTSHGIPQLKRDFYQLLGISCWRKLRPPKAWWRVPSLKLTLRPWKWMIGRLLTFLEPGLFSGANSLLVSGSVVLKFKPNIMF